MDTGNGAENGRRLQNVGDVNMNCTPSQRVQYEQRLTQGVGAQISIAVHLVNIAAVPRRVTRNILWLATLATATTSASASTVASKHLVEEAKLGVGHGRE